MRERQGACLKCGYWADLGWAGTCLSCWESLPVTDPLAHDDWCAVGACAHGFGPIQIDGPELPIAEVIEGLDDTWIDGFKDRQRRRHSDGTGASYGR